MPSSKSIARRLSILWRFENRRLPLISRSARQHSCLSRFMWSLEPRQVPWSSWSILHSYLQRLFNCEKWNRSNHDARITCQRASAWQCGKSRRALQNGNMQISTHTRKSQDTLTINIKICRRAYVEGVFCYAKTVTVGRNLALADICELLLFFMYPSSFSGTHTAQMWRYRNTPNYLNDAYLRKKVPFRASDITAFHFRRLSSHKLKSDHLWKISAKINTVNISWKETGLKK